MLILEEVIGILVIYVYYVAGVVSVTENKRSSALTSNAKYIKTNLSKILMRIFHQTFQEQHFLTKGNSNKQKDSVRIVLLVVLDKHGISQNGANEKIGKVTSFLRYGVFYKREQDFVELDIILLLIILTYGYDDDSHL